MASKGTQQPKRKKGAKTPDHRPARARYNRAQRWISNRTRKLLKHLRAHPGDLQAKAAMERPPPRIRPAKWLG